MIRAAAVERDQHLDTGLGKLVDSGAAQSIPFRTMWQPDMRALTSAGGTQRQSEDGDRSRSIGVVIAEDADALAIPHRRRDPLDRSLEIRQPPRIETA